MNSTGKFLFALLAIIVLFAVTEPSKQKCIDQVLNKRVGNDLVASLVAEPAQYLLDVHDCIVCNLTYNRLTGECEAIGFLNMVIVFN